MTQDIEARVLRLIATDRVRIPISSISGKLKRRQPKLGKGIDLSEQEDVFEGNRAYARIESEDTVMKARKMTDAVDMFADKYPRHGKILKGYIEETRADSETHLYFGMQQGCRLTADDYIGVLTDIGLTATTARRLYPELIDISRKMSRKRDEERSVLIG